MSSLAPALSLRSLGLLALAALPVIVVSVAGSMATFAGLVEWYPGLRKPFFTPPNGVFPLVWTFLYALMALASWRILRAQGPGKARALTLYGAQLALNLMWSFAFFWARSPWAGVAVILPLIVLVALTIRAFRPLDAAAGNALVPYLAWISFAALLNLSIAVLN